VTDCVSNILSKCREDSYWRLYLCVQGRNYGWKVEGD